MAVSRTGVKHPSLLRPGIGSCCVNLHLMSDRMTRQCLAGFSKCSCHALSFPGKVVSRGVSPGAIGCRVLPGVG